MTQVATARQTPEDEDEAAPPAKTARKRGRGRITPGLYIGGGLLAFAVLFSLVAPLLSPYGVTEISTDRFSGPSADHWLGTDNLGRDLFTRAAHAIQASLLIAFLSTAVAALVGTPIGIMAGYLGGWVDQAAMRFADILLALPPILLALVIRVIFGPGLVPLTIGMGLIFAPYFARVLRAPTLSLREREFVLAAEIGGVRASGIGFKHLLPNAMTPLLVQFAHTASIAVMLEAGLSYLGQGIQPPQPSAGRMINEGQRFMETDPLLILVPGATIVIMTVAWNLIADGLQNYLAPRRSQLQVAVGRANTPTIASAARQPEGENQ